MAFIQILFVEYRPLTGLNKNLFFLYPPKPFCRCSVLPSEKLMTRQEARS